MSHPLLKAWQHEPETNDEQLYTPWAKPGWRSWNAMSPEVEFCEFAATLTKMIQPLNIIETGVGQGYATRRVAAEVQDDQIFLCFESDQNLRNELAALEFFSQKGHYLAQYPTPRPADFAEADFVLLDSDFGVRSSELQGWWENAQPGSVVLVHDCGNGHDEGTGHATLAAFIQGLGIIGVFLKNPRGSFLGIK